MNGIPVIVRFDGVTIKFPDVDHFADWLASIVFEGRDNDAND